MKRAPLHRVAWAFLAAVGVVAIGGVVVGGPEGFVIYGAFGFVFAGFVGMPLYIFLRYLQRESLISLLIVGGFAGLAPTALLFYPWDRRGSGSSVWMGKVAHILDGAPTQAAWVSYYEGLYLAGVLGVLGGASFWLCLGSRTRS